MKIRHKVAKLGKEIKQRIADLKKKQDEYIQPDEIVNNNSTSQETPSTKTYLGVQRMLKFRAVAIFMYYLYTIAFSIIDIIYLVFTGLVLAIAMETFILRFSKYTKRGVAIFLSYFFLIAFVVPSITFVILYIFSQLIDLTSMFINYLLELQNIIKTQGFLQLIQDTSLLPDRIKEIMVPLLTQKDVILNIQNYLIDNLSQIAQFGSTYVGNVGGSAVSAVSTAFEAISAIFSGLFKVSLVLILSVFFSIEKDDVINFIATLGGGRKEYYKTKIEKIYLKLGYWLKTQFLLCIYIGVLVYILLWIMALFGVSLPGKTSLALISGITEFIPYIGPTLGAIPAILVGISSNGVVGLLFVLVGYFVIQRTENNILIPYVMNKALGVSPVVVFMSMLLGGLIIGFVGIIIAVPIAVIISVLLEDTFRK